MGSEMMVYCGPCGLYTLRPNGEAHCLKCGKCKRQRIENYTENTGGKVVKRTLINSSDVKSIGWFYTDVDKGLCTLEIEFHRGGVYRYFDVPTVHCWELLQSRTPGRYVHEHIKQFKYEKVAA